MKNIPCKKKKKRKKQPTKCSTSLVVQWLRLHVSSARGMGSNPGQETKIPHAALCDYYLVAQTFPKKLELSHHH